MKKALSIIIILASLLSLIGCSKNADAPEGMQLVRGGEDCGYYFFAPEEWTVANLGEVSSAYASNVDSSSISYVETDMPAGTVREYIDESLKEFSFKVTPVYDIAEVTFGNAESALSFVYDYDYSGHAFRTKQIFATYDGRFGIFTFTALRESLSAKDMTQYDYYKEKIDKVISEFKFVGKGEATPPALYEYDEEGYALVSDPSVAKFSLYLTRDFTVDYSSGIVSAALEDGSSLTVSRVTGAGVDVGTYLGKRLDELSAIVTDLDVIEFEDEEGKTHTVNGKASLGNARLAASQEYTFVYNNTKYHVYQVCAVTFFDGFVFTYTATEENYGEHLELIKKIAEKVEF